jgi:hypothetical protein
MRDVPNSIATAAGGLRDDLNGRLPGSLLTTVTGGGSIHVSAAAHWRALVAAFGQAFKGAGYTLHYTGIYRTFTRQLQMLHERYDRGYFAGRRDYNFYDGTWWSLKPGNAMAATPGRSNHGWGLSVDTAIKTRTGSLVNIGTGGGFTWMQKNAPHYGFFNEVASVENWHYTYVWGDLDPPYLGTGPKLPVYDPWQHKYGLFPVQQPKPALPFGCGYDGSTAHLRPLITYVNHVLIFEAGQAIPEPYFVVLEPTLAAMNNLRIFFDPKGSNTDWAEEAWNRFIGYEGLKAIDALASL